LVEVVDPECREVVAAFAPVNVFNVKRGECVGDTTFSLT